MRFQTLLLMKKLWGARFTKQSDRLADAFSFSMLYDFRLAKYDCLSSIAHARMLAAQQIITAADLASPIKLSAGKSSIRCGSVDQTAELIGTR